MELYGNPGQTTWMGKLQATEEKHAGQFYSYLEKGTSTAESPPPAESLPVPSGVLCDFCNS